MKVQSLGTETENFEKEKLQGPFFVHKANWRPASTTEDSESQSSLRVGRTEDQTTRASEERPISLSWSEKYYYNLSLPVYATVTGW